MCNNHQITRVESENRHLSPRSWRQIWLAASVGALLCVSGQARGDNLVPFKASFAGWDFASFPDACTVIVRHIDEGYATHFGRCTYTSTTVSDTCIGGMPGHDDDVTITAANGDQLFGTSVDSSELDDSDPTRIQIVGESIITITGGTGRFAHSTGTLRWSFVAKLYEATPLPDGTLIVPNYFSLDGTLSSVGTNKK